MRKEIDEQLEKDIIRTLKLLEKEIEKNLSQGIFVNVFDLRMWQDIIDNNTFKSRKELIITSIIESLNDINFSYTDVETEYDRELKEMIKESGEKIRISINTIDENLKKDITQILASQRDDILETLLAMTSERFDGYYTRGRAGTIARTTTTVITEGSKDKVWTKYGYSKVWLTQRDSKVRDRHRDADGQEAKNGLFKVDGELMRYPGAGSRAENNINCRCTLFPKL